MIDGTGTFRCPEITQPLKLDQVFNSHFEALIFPDANSLVGKLPNTPEVKGLVEILKGAKQELNRMVIAHLKGTDTCNAVKTAPCSAVELSEFIAAAHLKIVLKAMELSGYLAFIKEQRGLLVVVGNSEGASLCSDLDLKIFYPDFENRVFPPGSNLLLGLGAVGLEVKVTPLPLGSLSNSFAPREIIKSGPGVALITSLFNMIPVHGDFSLSQRVEVELSDLVDDKFNICVIAFEMERIATSGDLHYRDKSHLNIKLDLGGLRDFGRTRWLKYLVKEKYPGETLTDASVELKLIDCHEILLRAKHCAHSLAIERGTKGDDVNCIPHELRIAFLELFSTWPSPAGRHSQSTQMDKKSGAEYEIGAATSTLGRIVDNAFVAVRSRQAGSGFTSLDPESNRLDQITSLERLCGVLSSTNRVGSRLDDLIKTGIIGSAIPEFERSQYYVEVQYVPDTPLGRHLANTVREIEIILNRPDFCELFQPEISANDRKALFLAGVLHDISKPEEKETKDHHEKGGQIGYEVAKKLGWTEEVAQLVKNLIQDHMLVSEMLKEIRWVDKAQEIVNRSKTREYLQLLCILALADRRATVRQQAVTDESAHLAAFEYLNNLSLSSLDSTPPDEILFRNTAARLGIIHEPDAIPFQEFFDGLCNDGVRDSKLIAELYASVNKIRPVLAEIRARDASGKSKGPAGPEAQGPASTIPGRNNSVWHSGDPCYLSLRFPTLHLLTGHLPIVPAELVLVGPDTRGLFRQFSELMARNSIAISEAALHTTSDGIAVDIFRLNVPKDGAYQLEDQGARDYFTLRLAQILKGEIDPGTKLISLFQKASSTGLVHTKREGGKIQVGPGISNSSFKIKLEGYLLPDLIGTIDPAFELLKLNIIQARINSGNRGVVNTFLLKGGEESLITPKDIEQALRLLLEPADDFNTLEFITPSLDSTTALVATT